MLTCVWMHRPRGRESSCGCDPQMDKLVQEPMGTLQTKGNPITGKHGYLPLPRSPVVTGALTKGSTGPWSLQKRVKMRLSSTWHLLEIRDLPFAVLVAPTSSPAY